MLTSLSETYPSFTATNIVLYGFCESSVSSFCIDNHGYRYLQEAPSAKLVVVIENPLPEQKKWLVDYVVKDRGLMIAWDGDQKTLKCPPDLSRDLAFLA